MHISQLSLAVSVLFLNNAFASVLPNSLQQRDARVYNEALARSHSVTLVSTATASASATTASSPAAAASSAVVVKQKSDAGILDVTNKLMSLGFKNLGQNSKAANGGCWLGSGGPNENLVKNGASEPIIVVVWGPMGSWMTDAAKPPYITVGLNPGESTTVSCADVSGGIAAIYKDTPLSSFGQVHNTWVEFTYGAWGTVDVSREVRMDGNPASVVGSKCTTDMTTCVFTCKSGNVCGDAGTYQINNCGAHNNGQASADLMNGGCLMGANAKLTTTFS